MSEYIGVVIINYNGHNDTIECLQSLLPLKEGLVICVVDNSSDDRSSDLIKDWLNNVVHVNTLNGITKSSGTIGESIPFNILTEESVDTIDTSVKVNIIRAHRNDGFAAANNIGIGLLQKYYSCDWVWLLNNDTVVAADILSCFSREIESIAPDVGVVGSVLMEYSQPDKVQAVGGKYNPIFGIITNVNAGMTLKESLSQVNKIVSYPVAASIFLKKEFLSSIGLMNEGYFLYYEELDWIERAKLKGWKFVTSYSCKVWHKGGASINANENKTILSDLFLIRAKLQFTFAYYRWFVPTIYIGIAATLLNRIRRRQWDRVPAILRICFNPGISIAKTLTLAGK